MALTATLVLRGTEKQEERLEGRIGWQGKEIFDKIFAVFFIILTLPLFLVIAALVKLTSRGPVFYKQERLGYRGKPFRILKFRTMVVDAEKVLKDYLKRNPQLREEYEKYFKLKKDPRITPLGRILRKTSLDELPQLFNILLGNMSVVGPRPIIQEEVAKYGENAEKLFSVKPGLTGLWQVSGRADLTYDERVKLDMEYIERQSFFLDLFIILKTVPVIFRGHGAY
ncbi:MAG: sugar transferase [Candidatus Hydrothermae bacterium]|nr:sugar transferase [Candidatus Hydrothermae bacterium]